MARSKLTFAYPVCMYPSDEGGYTAIIPDLPGCVTEGNDLVETLYMVQDAGCGWLLEELEEGKKLPKPSAIEDIHAIDFPNGFTTLVALDVGSYALKFGSKSVRKNCTIPAWLETFANQNHISLSEVLQNALIGMYNKSILN